MSTMQFGGMILEITDPNNIQPVSGDVFTEIRDFNGIICLSFATLTADGDEKTPRVEVCARVRINLTGAADLRNALDTLLKGALPKESLN